MNKDYSNDFDNRNFDNNNFHNRDFYKDKKVFVTGHTGYKGAWLTVVLHELGAKMTGYALKAAPCSLFEKINGNRLIHSIESDIRDFSHLRDAIRETSPEIVIHLAAQAIVKDCFENPRYAYNTNVMGTVNLLEAVRECPTIKSVLIITTDKVYENKGDGAVYVEEDPLGGVDPYSSSKTCMEYITETYKKSYLQTENRFIGVSTVRASNVLGGGDHVQTRLIPSILNAISENKPVELRNPTQTRPWQGMLDALNGYLTLSRLMYQEPAKYSSQWNIGPTLDGIREVLWVVEKMKEHYNSAEYSFVKPFEVKESKTLGLDISKILKHTDWKPLLSCDKMLYNVVEFYKMQKAGVPELEICKKQIHEFFGIEQ